MKVDLSRCAVVVAGAWNQAIFTPTWVGQRLLPGAQIKIQVGFALRPYMQFRANEVQFSVVENQLHIAPLAISPAVFASMEEIAKTALGRLPETPVVGVGLNFGFNVPEACEPLDRLFALSDEAKLRDLGATTLSTTVVRAIKLKGATVNLTVGTPEEGRIRLLDFNHHFPISGDAEAARKVLAEGTPVQTAFEVSTRLAAELYGLTWEAA